MKEDIMVCLSDDKTYLIVKTLSFEDGKVILRVTHDKDPEHINIFLETKIPGNKIS